MASFRGISKMGKKSENIMNLINQHIKYYDKLKISPEDFTEQYRASNSSFALKMLKHDIENGEVSL